MKKKPAKKPPAKKKRKPKAKPKRAPRAPRKKRESWAWPLVWIVDPLGRLSASLQEELAARGIAGRKVGSIAAWPDRNEPWPVGVLFASDDPFSRVVLGYLFGRRHRGAPHPIAWLSHDAISIADFWQGKTVVVRSTAAPALAKEMTYRIRKRARP